MNHVAYLAGPTLTAARLIAPMLALMALGWDPVSILDAADEGDSLRNTLEANVALVMDADVVVTVPGWEDLASSRMAVELATALGKPVSSLASLEAGAVA